MLVQVLANHFTKIHLKSKGRWIKSNIHSEVILDIFQKMMMYLLTKMRLRGAITLETQTTGFHGACGRGVKLYNKRSEKMIQVHKIVHCNKPGRQSYLSDSLCC